MIGRKLALKNFNVNMDSDADANVDERWRGLEVVPKLK